jgi:hypothetical protein
MKFERPTPSVKGETMMKTGSTKIRSKTFRYRSSGVAVWTLLRNLNVEKIKITLYHLSLITIIITCLYTL